MANAAPMGRRQAARAIDFMDDRDDVGRPGGVQTQNPLDMTAKLDAFSAGFGLNNAAEEAIILAAKAAQNGSDPC